MKHTEMKNKVDLDESDGGRWTLTEKRSPEHIFKTWGARSIHQYAKEGDLTQYMILLEDRNWHYAHYDSTGYGSVYCSPREGYAAEDGEEAVLLMDYMSAKESLYDIEARIVPESRAKLQELKKKLDDYRNAREAKK
jgi:hypothetical protein